MRKVCLSKELLEFLEFNKKETALVYYTLLTLEENEIDLNALWHNHFKRLKLTTILKSLKKLKEAGILDFYIIQRKLSFRFLKRTHTTKAKKEEKEAKEATRQFFENIYSIYPIKSTKSDCFKLFLQTLRNNEMTPKELFLRIKHHLFCYYEELERKNVKLFNYLKYEMWRDSLSLPQGKHISGEGYFGYIKKTTQDQIFKYLSEGNLEMVKELVKNDPYIIEYSVKHEWHADKLVIEYLNNLLNELNQIESQQS